MSIQPGLGPNIAPLYVIETYSKPRIVMVKDRAFECGGHDFQVYSGTSAAMVKDIADCQIENVRAVTEVLRDEGTCRDITEDVQIAVRQHLYDHSDHIPESLRDLISEVDGVPA